MKKRIGKKYTLFEDEWGQIGIATKGPRGALLVPMLTTQQVADLIGALAQILAERAGAGKPQQKS